MASITRKIGFAVGLLAVTIALAVPSPAQERKSLIKEIQQRGELRVGYATADPHSIKDSTTGQWKGIAADIMEEWAKELGVKHVAVDTSWDAMIAGLQAGKYDVAAALNRRPARALVVTFSFPYMYDTGTFAVNRTKVKARTFEELDKKGVKIALMMGTAEDKSLSRVAKNLEILRLPDQNETRIAVQSGRAQGLFDDISGNAKFAQENKTIRLIIPDVPILLEGIAFAIRKGYTNDDLQALDIMVEDFVNTGKLKAAQAKYGLPNAQDYAK
ncbi:MAG: transporter substrate-binding domain-containing protein [Candidatus Rokubacteria bacterium]|nr:transporter substrate-binding domain-containing protein [Candidatus Rokubacteria bacterium]